jgi:ribosomal protein L37AE/L43A
MGILRRKVKSPHAVPADARHCAQCGRPSLKRTVATYPVELSGKLAGRRIDVYRVEMDKCRHCGMLVPTTEGNAKVDRCTKKGIEFFLKHLR